MAAEALGFTLMPWQRHVADVALEHHPDGSLVYDEVSVTLPRQSGKSLLLLALACHRSTAMAARLTPRLLELGRPDISQRTYYTAQSGHAARKKMMGDWLPTLRRSRYNDAMVGVVRASGMEKFTFADHRLESKRHCEGSLEVVSSGEDAGHGNVTDLGLIDEAWKDRDDRREQALGPGTNTRPSSQIWLVSTAGTAESYFLRRKVDQGRIQVDAGATSNIAYFEWSADDDADPDDPDVWRGCMPALDRSTPIDKIASKRVAMDDDEFRRAYLNQWVQTSRRVIPYADWLACQVATAAPKDPVVYSIDANPLRTHAAIGMADAVSVELVGSYSDGIDAAVADLLEVHRASTVVIDKASPVASKVAELTAAGVRVLELDYSAAKAACGELYDAIVGHKVAVRPHDSLTAAVEGARKKMSGDRFTWSRSTPDVDVCPLNAVTFARHGARHLSTGATWLF